MANLDQTSNSNWTLVFICWIIAGVSTLGSLFFSEIMSHYKWIGIILYQLVLFFIFIVLLFFVQKSDYKVIYLSLFSTVTF